MIQLAVIGGSGLYKLQAAKLIDQVDIATPFGSPSDQISILEIRGQQVAFLPRHGRGHRLLPTEIPSRANIWALKSLGVRQILGVSAVGSLQEVLKPGAFVLCDQLIDRTHSRVNTFFGEGLVGHVPFAEPYCQGMRAEIIEACTNEEYPIHPRGSLVCMEGPLFSTKAESHLYRSWGAHLIGMTALPEAKLAREAEICFSLMGMVTDYDCWHESEESVSVEAILEVMNNNTRKIKEILPALVERLSQRGSCSCHQAAAGTLMTDPELIPVEVKRRLELFYGKYWVTESP